MKTKTPSKALKASLFVTSVALILVLGVLLSASIVLAAPTSPTNITYVTNSTLTSTLLNRSTDAKGTITTVTIAANQQDYKWKAYVGNVSGGFTLSDATNKAIYDWSSATIGEVYVSKYSNIAWGSIACVNQTSIDAEQTSLSMSASARDNINSTFNYTNHLGFNVGTTPITGCRSTATNVNDAPQTMNSGAAFQEILLRDTTNSNLVYATLLNASTAGYSGQLYDFQLIVGENESSTTPTTYFFWVELG